MTVTALSRLPFELVLLIVEHAARSEVFSRPGWVATMCLVCKVFRRVVTPILYHHITINLDDDNCDRLLKTCGLPDTPLFHTRSVLFNFDRPCTWTTFDSIACALVNLSAFAGPTAALAELSELVDELSLSSAHLTDILRATQIEDIQRVVNTLTWLHLNWELGGEELNQWPDISSSHVEYLAIDLFSGRDTIDEESVDLSPIASQAISPPRLRRVLLRPRVVHESDVQLVAQKVVDWAVDKRDQRIYVDDTFVPIRCVERNRTWAELDEQDAMAGHSIWLRGRQAWHPSSPTLAQASQIRDLNQKDDQHDRKR